MLIPLYLLFFPRNRSKLGSVCCYMIMLLWSFFNNSFPIILITNLCLLFLLVIKHVLFSTSFLINTLKIKVTSFLSNSYLAALSHSLACFSLFWWYDRLERSLQVRRSTLRDASSTYRLYQHRALQTLSRSPLTWKARLVISHALHAPYISGEDHILKCT